MTQFGWTLAVAVLVLVSCGRDNNYGYFEQGPPPSHVEPSGKTEVNPAGDWEFEYLATTPTTESKKYKLKVTEEIVQLNGAHYFKVESDERDPSLRALRFDTSKIDWVIAGDSTQPNKLTVESNTVLQMEGNSLLLGNYLGKPFARLTKLPRI